MNISFRCSVALLLAGALIASGQRVCAESPSPAQRLADEAVLALQAERADATSALLIEQPARARRELGAVIDARPPDGGLPTVMAVTPQRAAERIGLQVGDRVQAINDIDLQRAADPAEALREAVNAASGALRFVVDRQGSRLELGGLPDRIRIPAYRLQIEPLPKPDGCGRLSTFLTPPPSLDLYPVLLHEVDGRLAGSLDSEVVRVDAGPRLLKLSEHIAGERFQTRQNVRRQQLQRSEMFKYLEIDVQPNTKYHLAARFHPERREPIRAQAYWEPVIWKQSQEPCR